MIEPAGATTGASSLDDELLGVVLVGVLLLGVVDVGVCTMVGLVIDERSSWRTWFGPSSAPRCAIARLGTAIMPMIAGKINSFFKLMLLLLALDVTLRLE